MADNYEDMSWSGMLSSLRAAGLALISRTLESCFFCGFIDMIQLISIYFHLQKVENCSGSGGMTTREKAVSLDQP